MAHTVCHDVGNWVEQNVQEQVQQCVEQDCDWWCACCNKWFCFLVWVIVTIVTWVVTTVCEVVADIVDLIVGIVVGLYDMFAGLFTGNWARIWDGFMEIVGAVGQLLGLLLRTVTLGGLVGAFIDGAEKWILRGYVRDLVNKRFARDPETRDAVINALGINGGFGLYLNGTALRTFIRSDFRSNPNGPPDLVTWLQDPNLGLDLKQLAGFEWTSFWQRGRPELVGDSGDLSADDLDNWVVLGGQGDAKQFSLFCMEQGVFQDRVDTAARKGQELAIYFNWTTSDVHLVRGDQVSVNQDDLVSFLTSAPFNRHSRSDLTSATNELCSPVAIGVFRYWSDERTGQSAHLFDATCVNGDPFRAEGATGATFKDRLPDFVWQWVAIHELGHTFGLCHVDGLDHIMYTGAPDQHKSWWDWSVLFNYLLVSGEPGFSLDEQKRVWDYIIGNFSTECLLANPSRR